ncbi:hypothetical protein TUN199_12273, partial [Pyrenophora tritici-repentis]
HQKNLVVVIHPYDRTRPTNKNVSTEILEFLPTTWELSWIEDAIRSWEEPTLPISEEEKQEIYDELCQTRNDWKTFQHGHKRKAKDI